MAGGVQFRFGRQVGTACLGAACVSSVVAKMLYKLIGSY